MPTSPPTPLLTFLLTNPDLPASPFLLESPIPATDSLILPKQTTPTEEEYQRQSEQAAKDVANDPIYQMLKKPATGRPDGFAADLADGFADDSNNSSSDDNDNGFADNIPPPQTLSQEEIDKGWKDAWNASNKNNRSAGVLGANFKKIQEGPPNSWTRVFYNIRIKYNIPLSVLSPILRRSLYTLRYYVTNQTPPPDVQHRLRLICSSTTLEEAQERIEEWEEEQKKVSMDNMTNTALALRLFKD